MKLSISVPNDLWRLATERFPGHGASSIVQYGLGLVVGSYPFPLEPFVLCSDGLYREIRNGELISANP